MHKPSKENVLMGLLVIALAISATSLAVGKHAIKRAGEANRRLGHDEHATCVVQARGLPAGHHLAAAFRDINVFLQPVPGEPTPPKVIKGKYNPVYFAIINLRKELPLYNALEEAQPATRIC